MTPEELDKLDALVKAAPRLHMSFDVRERLQARRALSKPGYATVATLVMLEGADV